MEMGLQLALMLAFLLRDGNSFPSLQDLSACSEQQTIVKGAHPLLVAASFSFLHYESSRCITYADDIYSD